MQPNSNIKDAKITGSQVRNVILHSGFSNQKSGNATPIINSPGTMTNVDGGEGTGTDPWSNVNNATSSDDAYATCAMGGLDSSDFLDATNFGFNIASGSSIRGIKVEIERKGSATNAVSDILIQIIKGGTATGTSQSLGANWPTTDAYESFGDRDNLWGTTWTTTDINASNFGVRIQAVNNTGSSKTASVDHIRITVYYSS